MRPIKTKVHNYCLNLKNSDEAKTYTALCAERKAAGRKLMAVYSRDKLSYKNYTSEVTIDPGHFFDNQSNTLASKAESGKRIFDWYETIVENKDVKIGMWTEITPELQAARDNTRKCGYCGHQYGPYHNPAPADGFCDRCLTSEYLQEKDLPLLRLRPVSDKRHNHKLTKAQLDDLLPRYVTAQTTGAFTANAKRLEEQRAEVQKEFEKKQEEFERGIDNPHIERAGKEWLLSRGISLSNVLFYRHLGVFSFGWRGDGVGPSVKEALLKVLADFPYRYEIRESK